MKAREVVTVVTWALLYASVAVVLNGVLFGWADGPVGIARSVIAPAVVLGSVGAWEGIRRIKKRRKADQANCRVEATPGAKFHQ